MAMVGLVTSCSAAVAPSAILSYCAMLSADERCFSNCEMSAPEMKALSPAPLRTMTRTSGSRSKWPRMTGIACHMSSDSALRRAGLLNTIQPIAPSISAIMRSLGEIIFRSSSNRAVAVQSLDGIVVIPELAQHRVGVLAALRRRAVQPRRRAAQRDRLSDQVDAAERRMIDRLGDAQMLHLRVGEDLVHAVDRARRHARRVDDLDPLGRGLGLGDLLDRGVEPVAVLEPSLVAGVLGIAAQSGRAQRLAQALEHLGAGGGDIDVTVLGLEHAGRNAGRVIVAGLARHFPGDEPARRLEIEHGDLRRQQRRLDILALA